MIGHYIADTIMCSKKMTYEISLHQEEKAGFREAFDDYNNKWERHPFEVQSDDALIKGEYIINPADSGERKRVVIIAHGLSAIRYSDLKYGKMFYDKGFSLVIFDERYFGESTGPYSTLGYKESGDLKKIIAYTKTVFGNDMFWGLHGESMGAATVLNVLDTETPDFVVADCPFADAGLLIRDLGWQRAFILGPAACKVAKNVGMRRYNYDYSKVVPINSVKTSNVPICFMHGDKDMLINCKHSEMMYKECKNPLSELHIFEGADHAQSVVTAPKRYEQQMMDFVEKIISCKAQ